MKDGEKSYFIWVKRPEHLPDNPAPISERGRFAVSVWVVGYLNLCLRDVSLFCLLLGFTTCVSVLNLTLTLSFPSWTQFQCVCVCLCDCVCVRACVCCVCLRFSRTDRSQNFIFYDNGKNDMIRCGILSTIHVCFSLSADVSTGCDWHVPLVRKTRESLFSYSDPSIYCIFQLMQWHNPIRNQYPHIWKDKIWCCFKRVDAECRAIPLPVVVC